MKKGLLFSLVASATLSGVAQINSSMPDGYATRGILMYNDKNYQGAIDQFGFCIAQGGTPQEMETSMYYIAQSRLLSGDLTQARSDFNDFLTAFPASPMRVYAKLALADCDFYEGDYPAALEAYRRMDASSFDGETREDYEYRLAYCELQEGNYNLASRLFGNLENVARYSNAARFYQGYIAYAQGDYDTAKQKWSSVDTNTPPGNHAPYYLAQIAYSEGDYDRALSLARKHEFTVKEYTPEMQRIAGESLYNLGEESEAVDYISKYMSATDSPKPSALYIMGVNAYKNGDTQQALKYFEPVTSEDNAMGQSAYLYMGQSYLQDGNVNSALLALDKACRMDYDRQVQETAFYNYAVAKSEGGRTPFGSSVTLFEDFLKRYPESRYSQEVEEYLVTGYMTDNNYEKALASINRIKRPSSAILTAKQRVLYILGSRDVASGNIPQAIERFTEAKKMTAQNRSMSNECNLWLGDCYFRQGNYSRATQLYREYLKGNTASAANRAIANYDLGYSLFSEKKYADARSAFEKAAKDRNLKNNLVADAYNRIGDCYYYASDFNRASQSYDQAYELNPAAGDYSLFQKATMKGLARDYNSKIQALDDMMERYPSSSLIPAALLEKAESYVALNRNDDAVSTYETLVKRYPNTAQGRNGQLQLAITTLSKGNTSKAVTLYKEVIRNYPSSDEAKVAAEDLKSILADEGKLNEYATFIASVPNAPKFEASEMDELTFQSAEKAYLLDNSHTGKLESYIAQFPGGKYEVQALSYLADQAFNKHDEPRALEYASTIVARYPDTEFAEDALAIKGQVEYNQGNGNEALATFRQLENRASASRNRNAARLGIIRVSHELGNHKDVLTAANQLLASSVTPSAQKNEILFAKAYSLAQLGQNEEAIDAWKELAADTDDLYGAKSAYYLSQFYYDKGQLKNARSQVEKFIDSNTPHQYWLARGYILLSDIYRKNGETFEANEYLKSLKDNYPGNESDIFMMIDERLK